IPAFGVYFVKPASNASIAALFMCSGVSKSGSPAPKPQTSIPSAFMAFALLSIERVNDGVSCAARSEISMFGKLYKMGALACIVVRSIAGGQTIGDDRSFQSEV